MNDAVCRVRRKHHHYVVETLKSTSATRPSHRSAAIAVLGAYGVDGTCTRDLHSFQAVVAVILRAVPGRGASSDQSASSAPSGHAAGPADTAGMGVREGQR